MSAEAQPDEPHAGEPVPQIASPEPEAAETAADGQSAQQASLPGAVLLAERRAQGLSLGDVARQLKLSVRQVEALERDDYASFPGPVFVRGFLRNYAKLLHLDAEWILELAHLPSVTETVVTQVPVPAPRAIGRSNRLPVIAGVVVLLILVGAMVALRGGKDRAHDRSAQVSAPGLTSGAVSPQHADSPPPSAPQVAAPPTEATGSNPATTGVAPDSQPAAGASTKAAAPASADTTPAVVTGEPGNSPTPSASSAAAPSVVGSAPARLAQAQSERAEVRVAFEDECWVEIKDAKGEVVFSVLGQAGSQRTVRATPPLSLVVGNATAVKLTFRGQSVDLAPHTRMGVAKLILE